MEMEILHSGILIDTIYYTYLFWFLVFCLLKIRFLMKQVESYKTWSNLVRSEDFVFASMMSSTATFDSCHSHLQSQNFSKLISNFFFQVELIPFPVNNSWFADEFNVISYYILIYLYIYSNLLIHTYLHLERAYTNIVTTKVHLFFSFQFIYF